MVKSARIVQVYINNSEAQRPRLFLKNLYLSDSQLGTGQLTVSKTGQSWDKSCSLNRAKGKFPCSRKQELVVPSRKMGFCHQKGDKG